MKLRKSATAVLLALAVTAAFTASASGAVTTSAAQWYTGASPGTTLAGEQALTTSIGEYPELGKKWTWHWSFFGLTIHITVTGLECVGCKISNAEVTAKAGKIAIGRGKLKFTGVTAMAPSGCTIRNATETGTVGVIETKPMVVHADWMNTTKAYQQFFPETGSSFATIYIEGGGCEAIEGPYNLTGTLFGEAKNPTGVQAGTQEVVFSPAIQTAAGGELKIGTTPFEMTGTGAFSIGGTAFGIH
jgi:hypothetical protein